MWTSPFLESILLRDRVTCHLKTYLKETSENIDIYRKFAIFQTLSPIFFSSNNTHLFKTNSNSISGCISPIRLLANGDFFILCKSFVMTCLYYSDSYVLIGSVCYF